jgi:5-methylcytosine-specific restriction endonuclease McrA
MPRFAKGYCVAHQYLRTDKERHPITLAQKPLKTSKKGIKKQSDKMKAQIPARQAELQKQWAFFMDIWDNSPHFCRSCSTPLGDEARSYHFDHLLEKARYLELKFEKDNILLVCLSCHSRKTDGHPTEKHLEYINKAKERFLQ